MITQANLAAFYKRRQYNLQHLKYKLLQRWANHTLTSESMERTGSTATYLYGKIEYTLELAMQRKDRLEQDSGWDRAVPENRPSTKAENSEGSLYVENKDILPQSLIKEDDIEVYLRHTTYKNKVSKMINKFMSRQKWIAMQHRFEIFEKAVAASCKQR